MRDAAGEAGSALGLSDGFRSVAALLVSISFPVATERMDSEMMRWEERRPVRSSERDDETLDQ